MGPNLLIGLRMLLAFIIVGFIFRKELAKTTREEVKYALLMSIFLFTSMFLENVGLQTTASSNTSFIENGVVIGIPLAACLIYRTLPSKETVVSVVFATIGMLFLSLKGTHLSFTSGEICIIACSLLYICFVLVTDVASKKCNAKVLGTLMLLFVGIFSIVAAFFTEGIRLPQSAAEYGALFGLAIFCSALGLTLQPIAQEHVEVSRAGLMNAVYPVTAAVLGVIFLHEHISWSALVGCLLVMLAIAYPYISKKYFGSKDVSNK